MAKTCPDRSQAFKKVNIGQAFPFDFFFFILFLKEPIVDFPRHAVKSFTQLFEDLAA